MTESTTEAIVPGDHEGPRSVAVPNSASFPKALLGYGKELASLRDGILALGAIVYFLGYTSWALYASERELGMIPVLKAQYLAAGMLPSITLLFASLVEHCRRELLANRRVREILTRNQRITALHRFYYVDRRRGFRQSATRNRDSPVWVFVPGLLLFASGAYLKEGKHHGPLRHLQVFSRWFGRYVYTTLFVCAYLFYVEHWFPKQWQEFGGPRPERVQFDVDSGKLSSETIRILLPTATTNRGIFRSRETYLILATAEYFLLQTNADISPTSRIFKIKTSAVESVFPIRD